MQRTEDLLLAVRKPAQYNEANFMMMKTVVVLLFLALFLPQPVLAQSITLVPSLTPTPTMSNYQLPYPGILPDNPLYIFKAARDRVISWLISDPVKRAQFDLLQADKRLQMAVYLLQEDKAKAPLAISTISKGENYFQEAVNQANSVSGRSADDVKRKLNEAAIKHEQVVAGLAKQVPGHTAEFLTLEQRIASLRKEISSPHAS